MGKFDGILLCTDLDDTLLTTDKRVSDENSKAIEYFNKTLALDPTNEYAQSSIKTLK